MWLNSCRMPAYDDSAHHANACAGSDRSLHCTRRAGNIQEFSRRL